MSQIPAPPVAAPMNLPSAHILSYVTSANTPTRVRALTAKAIRIVGLFYAGAVVLDLVKLLFDLQGIYHAFGHSPMPWDFFLKRLAEQDFIWIALLFLAITGISTALGTAGPVGRARREACAIAVGLLGITLFLVGIAATSCGVWALDRAFQLPASQKSPVQLLWLLLTVLAIPTILLLHDILRYVQWIARHPALESPPVPFLPQLSAPSAKPSEGR